MRKSSESLGILVYVLLLVVSEYLGIVSSISSSVKLRKSTGRISSIRAASTDYGTISNYFLTDLPSRVEQVIMLQIFFTMPAY